MGQAKARRNKFGKANVHSPMEYFAADVVVAVPGNISTGDAQSAIAEATLIASLPNAFNLDQAYAGAETFLMVKEAQAPLGYGKDDILLIDAAGQYRPADPQFDMGEFHKVPGYNFTYYRLTSAGEAVAISVGQFISAVNGPIEDPIAFSVGKVRKSGTLVTIADRPFSDQLIGAIESDLREDDVDATIAHAIACARWSDNKVGTNRWANADLDFFLSFLEMGADIFAVDPDQFTGRTAAFATVISLGDYLLITPFIESYITANKVDLRVWRPRKTDVQNIWADFHSDAQALAAATGHEFSIPDLAARTSVEYAAAMALAPEKVRDLEAFLATGKIVAHLTSDGGTMELFDFGDDMLLVLTTAELKEMVTWSKSSPIGRTIEVPDEMIEGLNGQLAMFEEKFGRRPGPKDPIFFDPNADTPRALTEGQIMSMMTEAMRDAGMPKQFLYAYEKTNGMLVTDMNRDQWSKADLDQYEAAISEYFSLVEQGKDPYATNG